MAVVLALIFAFAYGFAKLVERYGGLGDRPSPCAGNPDCTHPKVPSPEPKPSKPHPSAAAIFGNELDASRFEGYAHFVHAADSCILPSFETVHSIASNACRFGKEAAAKALIDAIDGIMAQTEATMAGVMIKAPALAAWGLVQDRQRLLTPQAAAWGPALGASVVRMAGEA
ncbi:hypothetical protein [Mesorhizobium huakuii]|uniref:Uncharacterized protein n=1 Tax=Mesorhizobium huakuii TaxID=28104 RepID=A0A7G6T2J9_9HYPH|nr:hypothetical protein HB778_34270 [Mesorhizobium huakuii]